MGVYFVIYLLGCCFVFSFKIGSFYVPFCIYLLQYNTECACHCSAFCGRRKELPPNTRRRAHMGEEDILLRLITRRAYSHDGHRYMQLSINANRFTSANAAINCRERERDRESTESVHCTLALNQGSVITLYGLAEMCERSH